MFYISLGISVGWLKFCLLFFVVVLFGLGWFWFFVLV